jgi:hypothetical protein
MFSSDMLSYLISSILSQLSGVSSLLFFMISRLPFASKFPFEKDARVWEAKSNPVNINTTSGAMEIEKEKSLWLSLLSLSSIMIPQLYVFCTLAALTIYILITVILRLSSPITAIPGPNYTKITSLWLKMQEFTSNRRPYIHSLHQKYGPVVQLAPNEVSFTSLEALKEIYTSGGSGYDKTEFYSLFMQFATR